jgi:hypothetical protein
MNENARTDHEKLKQQDLEAFEANLAHFLEKTCLSEDQLADMLTIKRYKGALGSFDPKAEIPNY